MKDAILVATKERLIFRGAPINGFSKVMVALQYKQFSIALIVKNYKVSRADKKLKISSYKKTRLLKRGSYRDSFLSRASRASEIRPHKYGKDGQICFIKKEFPVLQPYLRLT